MTLPTKARNVSEALLSELRSRVCSTCSKRPLRKDDPAAAAARCEDGCAVFQNLPSLLRMIDQAESDPALDYEQEIRAQVCRHCGLSSTAGAYCHKRLNASCALTLYQDRIVRMLEPLVLGRCGSD